MPPQLALLLTAGFIAALFVRDSRLGYRTTSALWIPLGWMLITGSRFVSEWLNPGATGSYRMLADGSPVDRAFFLGLIAAGAVVLWHRRLKVLDVALQHGWLLALLAYSLVAVLWSDFPFVALKRWIKILGHPIMALIIFTEPDPRAALHRVMMRASFILVPLSVTLIKYFPNIGRSFEWWTGAAMNTGVTTNKNALGYVCLVLGLYLAWHLKDYLSQSRAVRERRDVAAAALLLGLVWYLLVLADSKTSLMCLLVGIAAMFAASVLPAKRLGTYFVVGAGTYMLLDSTVGIYATVVQLLGRNMTLTDRTDLWNAVLAVPINPLVGAGFESFWLGERLLYMRSLFAFGPNQAHNGYIETYLNLGWIGVVLLIGLIVATFMNAKRFADIDRQFSHFRIALLGAIVLYNYTEATFKAVHFVWFAFYLIATDYTVVQAALPQRQKATPRANAPTPRTQPRRTFKLLPRFGGAAVRRAIAPAATVPPEAAAPRWIVRTVQHPK
jgi:exopolysaccharide production protein ExoQ